MVKPKLGNLLLLGFGEIATRGFSFLAFSYLGHILAPEDLGIYESALAVIMFGTLALDQGLGIHGSRGIARNPGDTEGLVRRIVSAQLWLAALAYAILWGGTSVILLERDMVILLRGFGLTLFATPFLLNWVFQGRNEMLWYAVPTAVRQLTFLILVVLVVRDAEDLTRLPVAEVGAATLAAIVFVLAYKKTGLRLHVDPRAGWNQELFREALPIGISNLIWALRTYLPILVILATLDAYHAGLFAAGHRIIVVFIAFLGVYFTNVFPAMSAAARQNHKGLTELIRQALVTSVLGTIAVAIVTSLTADLMIGIVLGPNYVTSESVASMTALAWLLPILAWRRCARSGLIVLDHQKSELACSLIGLALLVMLIFPLTKHHGLTGTVSAILISELTATILTWLLLKKNLMGTKNAS